MSAEHDAHVAAGFCSAIKWTKAWCNSKAGHSLPRHSAVYVHRDGKKTYLFWEDGDHPYNIPARPA